MTLMFEVRSNADTGLNKHKSRLAEVLKLFVECDTFSNQLTFQLKTQNDLSKRRTHENNEDFNNFFLACLYVVCRCRSSKFFIQCKY